MGEKNGQRLILHYCIVHNLLINEFNKKVATTFLASAAGLFSLDNIYIFFAWHNVIPGTIVLPLNSKGMELGFSFMVMYSSIAAHMNKPTHSRKEI